MTDVLFPEIPEQSLSFHAVTRYRGPEEQTGASAALDGRVFLGGPTAFPMTAKRYPGMRAYLEADAAHHRYYEVHLALSFKGADEPPPVHTVSLEMRLSSPASATQPIAWSMAPARIEDPADRDLKFEIRPQIKIVGVEASAGSISGTVNRAGQPFLVALGELGSNPGWEIRHTSLPLDGQQRLILVIRAAKDVDTQVDIQVTATTKSSVLRRYRALPVPLKLSALL